MPSSFKLLHDRDDIPFQSDWIGNVKNILCESGFTFVWLQQETVLILNC